MMMLKDGAAALFGENQYRILMNNLRRYGRYTLWFDGDRIVAVRGSTGRMREVSDHIMTYSAKTSPTYEKVLLDIKEAAESYEQELCKNY